MGITYTYNWKSDTMEVKLNDNYDVLLSSNDIDKFYNGGVTFWIILPNETKFTFKIKPEEGY